MKININFTIEIAREKLPDLYEFMQTDHEGIRDSLTGEAAETLSEYLDGCGGISNVTIINGNRSDSR